MNVIFALFETYTDAENAVDELLDRDFDVGEMNAIVLEEVAKSHIDVDWDKLDVAVTDEIGERSVRGLTQLLGGQQPVMISGLEDIYAAGELATVLARTASAPNAEGRGLKAALVDFNVPEETAQIYRDGIDDGGLLFWIRVDEDRGAAVRQILTTGGGIRVGDYTGG